MNSRGFFSVFVAAFAVIFLISTFYAQSVKFDTQTRAAELGVIQQELSKDWFLARNALTNFAADAILVSIEKQYNANHSTPLGTASCIQADILGYDYAVDVNDYWHDAAHYMNANFGTNCDVNLNGAVQDLLEGTLIGDAEVRDGARAYGLLSCTRSTPTATLTVKRPFVIRKDVRVQAPCTIEVWDILGSHDSVSPIDFEELDVRKTYP